MRVVHISDTHNSKNHNRLTIPECDVLIHSGDIGGRTGSAELYEFLEWFEKQPARKKIWIAGNHDIIMDNQFLDDRMSAGTLGAEVVEDLKDERTALLKKFKSIVYLNNTDYVFEGTKFYGSPITPSFHRAHWAFNADRGEEIKKYWSRIPKDTNVLITHGPPYGLMDIIPESFKSTPDEDVHRGCHDLLNMVDGLANLQLHCFGHIHDGPTGVIVRNEYSRVIFSNGAILDNNYQQIVYKPLIITL